MKDLILRGFAFYVDSLFVGLLTFISFFGYHYILGDVDFVMKEFHSSQLLSYYFFSYFLYFIFNEYFFFTTIGKKIFKFKVIFKYNKSANNRLIAVFLRTFIRYVPLNQISFIFDKNNLFWHERWTYTCTCSAKLQTSKSNNTN